MNFRGPIDMFTLFVLNRKREPMRAPDRFHALPRLPDYSEYEQPTFQRRRANVARLRIERARKVVDLPVPAFLKRQAGPTS